MYLTIVDEIGSRHLLIMLSDGLRSKLLGDEFSQSIGPMLQWEIFQTPFSNSKTKKEKKKKKKTKLPAAVHPNEPSGFRGHKELLHRASALVTACP